MKKNNPVRIPSAIITGIFHLPDGAIFFIIEFIDNIIHLSYFFTATIIKSFDKFTLKLLNERSE